MSTHGRQIALTVCAIQYVTCCIECSNLQRTSTFTKQGRSVTHHGVYEPLLQVRSEKRDSDDAAAAPVSTRTLGSAAAGGPALEPASQRDGEHSKSCSSLPAKSARPPLSPSRQWRQPRQPRYTWRPGLPTR